MHTANADGTFSATGYTADNWWAGENSNTHTRLLIAGDWNGDGKTDLGVETIVSPANPSSYPFTLRHSLSLYHSTGTRFSANGYSISANSSIEDANDSLVPMTRVGDWNGDGRTDVFLQKDESQTSQLYTASSSGTGHMVASTYAPVWDSNSYSLKEGDFNADGRTDFIRCHKRTGAVAVYLSSGSSMYASSFTATGWQVYDLIPGDYNGDGNTDLFLNRHTVTGTSLLYFATGDGGFISSGYSATDWAGVNIKAIAGDWNGDGKADLIRTGGDLYLGTGTGLSPVGFNAGLGATLLSAGDWNGDGLSDLLSKAGAYGQSARQYTTTQTGFDVIDQITDGLGNDSDIVYKPITDSSVYTQGTGASYPEVDFQGAIYVVDSISTANGIGGQREMRYDYAGAKINVAGRGFLGFATMTALDVATDIQSQTRYRQDYPYTGLVANTEQRLHPAGSNTLLGKVTSTYASLSTHTGVTFPYAAQVVNEDYDLPTGAKRAVRVKTTTTNSSYDRYGNPLSIKVTTTGAGETTSYTANSYTNTPSTWHLGRLTRATVTQYLPGNTDTKDGSCTHRTPSTCGSRTSSFVYASASGLLTREVIEPDTPALRLQTDYTHDAFGNRTAVTVTGGSGATAIATRTTRTSYDSRGQFATTLTNALGHSETRTYDEQFGVMLSLQGPNQLTTRWEYDAFGRQLKERRADGTQTRVKRAWCVATHCPRLGKLKVITHTSGAPRSAVISDSLGREIKRATIGFNRNVIEVDTVYDAKGQVQQTSRPYFAGSTSESIKWHRVSYDELGRPLTETAPGTSGSGTAGVIVTTSRYNGLEVSITNDKGQVNKRKNNARGEIARVTDANNTLTDYRYDPFGNLISVVVDAGTAGEQVTTTNSYDLRGRKISMSDPDMGSWRYRYNALGELISQTDAKGQTTSMDYDLLGRLISRVDDEGGSHPATSTWVYDYDAGAGDNYADGQAHKSIGKLVKVSGGEGEQKTHRYDSYGRPDTTTTWLDANADGMQDLGEVYSVSQTYDQYSRPASLSYPASPAQPFGLSLTNHYSVDGHLKTVRNTASHALYWHAGAQNAQGQLIQFTYGNGITTDNRFDTDTGLIDRIQSHSLLGGLAGENDIQDNSYTFDSLGNLSQRSKRRQVSGATSGVIDQTYTETFQYDSLNRLTRSDHSNGTTTEQKTYRYDAIGNLTYKSDISSSHYRYGSQSSSCSTAGPHAAVEVDGHCLSYDANGNQSSGYNFTKRRSRTLTWTPYNKPRTIQEGATTLTFNYGADRARFKQTNTATNLTTYYIGGLYEKQINSVTGLTTHVHYIKAGGTTIATYKATENTNSNTNTTGATTTATELRYLHRDHLGSVTEITDENAAVVERLAYDAWGKRRAPTWTDVLVQLTSNQTLRGFTGHEMLDDVSLIHMNGRVYDPDLGRFLSADPFIQQPTNPQSFNRYSYVGNNPLSFTDPSGFFFKKLFKAFKGLVRAVFSIVPAKIRPFVAIAAVAIAGPAGLGTLSAAQAGALGGLIASGGDLKAGIIGAVTGGIAGGNGSALFKVAASAVVGGIGSELQGGNFLSGFLSGGVSGGLGASGFFAGEFNVGKLLVSAAVAGFASKLGGGKFGNGALTGAFAYTVAHGVNAAKRVDFDNMTDQVLIDWIVENKDRLGIDIPKGVDIKVMDHGLMFSKSVGRVNCDGPCVKAIPTDRIIEGNFNEDGNIEIYKNAFTPENNFSPVQQNPSGETRVTAFRDPSINRAEHAVFTLGHEAAHARGINLSRGTNVSHHEANFHGFHALRNFRKLNGK